MKALLAAAAATTLVPAADAPPAPVVATIPAYEARQGVASDGRFVYAVDNSRIAKYRIADGRRLGEWSGDPAKFPHLNSCAVVAAELVCASSNYPKLPQTGTIEVFDPVRLRHLRSHDLGATDGSLTALDRHGGAWWAVFAQYDGRGGAPGKSHRDARLVKLDGRFRPLASWALPEAVLDRGAPYSISGASWSRRGILALSGHDRPEIYLIAEPRAGRPLRLIAVVPVTTRGQAIAWDPRKPDRLWSIDRARKVVVASRIALPR